MVIIFILVLIGVAAALVVTPFLRTREVLNQNPIGTIPVEVQKEIVFTTLNEIEFDYQMKKLSEEDYEELKNQYQRSAVSLLDTGAARKGNLKLADLEKELVKEIERELEGIK